MARNLKSRIKLSRRVTRNLFLKGARSFSPKDEYSKKPFKTAIAGKKRPPTLSGYGKQLLEKQALKFTYGLLEKQLRNIFTEAFRRDGDTGIIALTLLEKRIDNVVYRGGLANSRSQARQLVNHGHFLINGEKVSIPSYKVKIGDIISIKENKQGNGFWKNFTLQIPNEAPSWLDTKENRKIKIVTEPLAVDLPQDINLPYIVEFYSRKV
jgi:small subunit ribosomal protein S4